MGRCAQLVIGPAGSGKSTFCEMMHTHCENLRRRVHIVNLDPAAEHFSYPVAAGALCRLAPRTFHGTAFT